MNNENNHNLLFQNGSVKSFYDLKKQVDLQYLPLGYTRIAIDKEYSYMITKEEQKDSYIQLKFNESTKEIVLSCFNSEKPEISTALNLVMPVREISHEEIESLKQNFMITSETHIDNEIIERLGIVSAQCIFGVNIMKDLFSFVRDIVGGRINSLETGLDEATEVVLKDLERKAILKHANAIVALKIEHTYNNTNSGNILSVYATGTAIKMKKLVVCYECGKEISNMESACPHCGAPMKK